MASSSDPSNGNQLNTPATPPHDEGGSSAVPAFFLGGSPLQACQEHQDVVSSTSAKMTSDQGQPILNGMATPPPIANAWNPASLLNPKGFSSGVSPGQTSQVPHRTGHATPAAPPDMDFHFLAPGDGFAIDLEPAPEPATSNYSTSDPAPSAVHAGFASHIERMNNVQERSDVPPPKRRRVEDGADEEAAKTGFAGSSHGFLGQYIKDQEKDQEQEKGKRQSSSAIEVLDLTAAEATSSKSDDRDKEVCYGQIKATINAHKIPAPKPGAVAVGGPGWWPQVKVVLRRRLGDPTSQIFVYDYTRTIFGLVDPKTSGGLAPLLDSTLKIRTDCRINGRRKEGDEMIGQEISRQYPFELVLYGPRRYAKNVGKHLLKHDLPLISPGRVEPGVSVFNPHVAFPQLQPVVKSSSGPSTASSTVPQGPPIARTAEEIRSEVMGVFDSLTQTDDLPEMQPGGDLIQTELLTHQKQALYFMTNRERDVASDADNTTIVSSWQRKQGRSGQYYYYNVITGQAQREPPPPTKGGILADMMGLGKTLSILSLITHTLGEVDDWVKSPLIQPRAPEKKPSHPSRHFDIPRNEGLGLTPLTHNGRATMLICPLTTITNWEEQIKQHVKQKGLKYHIYHGPNRIKDAAELAKFDLVITTYGSVSSELTARNTGKRGPWPLEEIGWFRIVLDEAHMIREQSTLQFKAVCRLQASRRWAVTGTPVQNRLDDLAALLAFLRLKPFDERTKFIQHIVMPFKNADTEIVPKLRVLVDTVTLRRLKDKINLPSRKEEIIRLKFSDDEQKLYDAFAKLARNKVQILTNRPGQGVDKVLGGKTYIHILQSILRLRLICAHGKDLLQESDLAMLQGMTADSAIDLDSDEEDEKPTLPEGQAYALFKLMKQTSADDCIKCRRKIGTTDGDDIESERQEDTIAYMTPCMHLYCPSCVKTFRDEAYSASWNSNKFGYCPVCQSHVKFKCVELRRSRADAELDQEPQIGLKDYSGPHTKTRALVEDLLQSKAESEAHPDEPPFKSVVFSGWTSHLDLIQTALIAAGVTYTRLDGKMTRPARTAAMDTFREDNSVHVILVSITAGGLGLNLTAGNNVYVMEPQYNPAAEAQAVDRVHRLGQKRPVRIVRYIMKNSFEEKMLELQEKKTKLANISMDGRDKAKVLDRTEAAKQRLIDLRSLFK